MAVSIETIQTSFEAVLRTSVVATSVAVRNALGNGVNSIIKADELTKDTIPTLPCIAIRWQTGGGARYQPQVYYPFIYIYDGLLKYWTRINPLLDLVKAAYPELDIIPYCETDYKAHSGEITDNGLGLRVKYIPFVIATR